MLIFPKPHLGGQFFASNKILCISGPFHIILDKQRSSCLVFSGGPTSTIAIGNIIHLEFPLDFMLWQVHGELDTKTGGPSFFAAIIRSFYPEVGIGCPSFWPQLIRDVYMLSC